METILMLNNVVPFKTHGMNRVNLKLKQMGVEPYPEGVTAKEACESLEYHLRSLLSDDDYEYLGYTSRYSPEIDVWELPSYLQMQNLRRYTPAMFDLLGITPRGLSHDQIKNLPLHWHVKTAVETSDFILQYFGLTRLDIVEQKIIDLPMTYEIDNYLEYTDEMWEWLGVDKTKLSKQDFADLPYFWEVTKAMK